jgi:hypothetical protein
VADRVEVAVKGAEGGFEETMLLLLLLVLVTEAVAYVDRALGGAALNVSFDGN